MFQGKLKVLLFEDNPGDVLLIAEMFKEEAAGRFELSSAARLADGIKRLSEQAFDAVLLDLNLPDSRGIDTARSLKQHAPGLPIVILTALADEAMALAALQLGMEDYLIKGQITGALLEHSLRYAIERKRVGKALRESEERFRQITENMLDAVSLLDKDGIIRYVSPSHERILGYKPEALVGRASMDFVHPEDRDSVLAALAGVFEKKEARFQYRFRHAGGHYIWGDASCRVVLDDDGNPSSFVIASRDVTDRKKAEDALRESKEIFTRFMEYSPIYIFFKDENVRVLQMSKNFEKMLGKPVAELLGKNMDDLFPSDLAKSMVADDMRILKEGKEITVEEELNGRIYSTIKFPIFIEGKPRYLAGYTMDITERKRAEEALRASEEKFSAAFRLSPAGIVLSTVEDGRYVEVSDHCEDLSGYTREEAVGHTSGELGIWPDPIERDRVVKKVREAGRIVDEEVIMRDRFGRDHAVSLSAEVITINQQRYLLSISTDVTERKRAEEALRTSERKMRSLFENSPDIIMIIDCQGKLLFINRTTTRTVEEALGTSSYDYLAPEYRQAYVETVARVFRTGKPDKIQTRGLGPGGDATWYETRFVSLEADGAGQTLMLISTDITERKRMEEELERKERYFRALIENSADGIMVLNRDMTIRYESPGCMRLLGYTLEDRVGRNALDPIHPDDAPAAGTAFAKVVSGLTAHVELRARHKDGSWRIVETTLTNLLDDPAVAGIVANLRDITERKRAEEALRDSEERYRMVFENSPVSIWEEDFSQVKVLLDGLKKEGVADIESYFDQHPEILQQCAETARIVDVNRAALALHGASSKEELLAGLVNTFTPESFDTFRQEMICLWNGGTSMTKDAVVKTLAGSLRHVTISFSVAPGFEETLSRVLVSLADITERKRMENELRQREELLRAFMDSATDSFTIYDSHLNLVDVNRNALQYLGFGVRREDVVGKNLADFIADKQRHVPYLKVMETGEPFTAEETFVLPNAGEFTVITRAFKVGDGLGIITNDVTERKRAEEALRDSEEKYRMLVENSADMVFSLDAHGNFTYVSPAAERVSGYRPDEIIGKSFVDFIDPEYLPDLMDRFKRTLAGATEGAEFKARFKDGSVGWIRTASRATLRDGKLVGLTGIMSDITERKRAEDALRESEARFRQILEQAPLPLSYVNKDGVITFRNERFIQLFGYTADDVPTLAEWWLRAYPDPQYRQWVTEHWTAEVKRAAEAHLDVEPAEYKVACKNGEERIIEISGITMGGDFLATFIDITERKRAEEALRKNEGVLRSLLDATPAGVGLLIDRVMIKVNNALCNITGYTREELEGSDVRMLYPNEEEYLRIGSDLYAQMDEEGIGVLEATLKHKNGEAVYVSLCLSPFDPNDRLAGVTATVLDITERKKAEEALRESEEKYRGIFDESIATVYVFDANKNFINTNQAGLDLLGYSREELLRMSIPDVDADPVVVLPAHQELLAGGRLINYEHRLRRKDGTIVSVLNNSRPLTDAQGNVVGMLSTLIDVTERKKAQEALLASEIKYRNLFEHTLLGMEVIDGATGKVALANHSMARMFGFKSPADMIGTNPMDHVLPEDLGWVIKQFGQVMADPQKYDVTTIRARTKDGRIIWVTGSTTYFEYEGKPSALISLIDTTVAKEAEDKLRESEGRYRLLAENISDVIWTMDLNFNYTYVSPSILHMRGFTAEEVTGLPLQNMLTPSSAKVFVEALKEEYAIESKGSADPFRYRTLELELRSKDGSLVWAETRLSFLYDSDGKRIGFMGVTRDITERKKAEEALRNSEEKLRVVFDSMMDGIVVSDSNINIVDVNKAVIEILGAKAKGELIGRNAADVIKLKHPEAVMANLVKMLQERHPQEKVEYSVVLPDDRELEVEVSTAMMHDTSGQMVGFVNAIRDVTERKQMDQALRESEERYRLLAENATDVIWVVGMDMRLTYISPSVTRLLGYTVEEALARTMAESYTSDSFAAATQILSQEMALEQTGQGDPRRSRILELELYRKDGTTVPVEANFSFLRNAAGNAVGILAMVRDITERKKAQEALRESEEKYRALVENSPSLVCIYQDKHLKYVNKSMCERLGWTYEEMTSASFNPIEKMHSAETQIIVKENVAKREKGEKIPPYEIKMMRRDGSEISIIANAQRIIYNGKPATEYIFVDITERKIAEEALLAKERYFRAISDLSSGAALVVSLDGNIVDITGGLERISGHNRASTLGVSALEFIHPDDFGKARIAFDEALQNPGKTVAFEARLKNARGEWQWTESMITNLLDNRDVMGIVNHLVDITERKKAEEDIKRHAKKVEALYGVAQAISQSSSMEVMLSEALDKVCDVMGAESGCIFLLDVDDKALKLKASRGLSEGMALKVSTVMLNEQGIEGLMNLTEPVTDIDETRDVVDVDKIREVVTELGRKAIVAAPFFRGKDLQGLIVVFTAKERTFSRDDLGLLAAIANEIAVGINNLMLLEKTRDLSVTDELTGLYNRRHFFDMLDVEMNRAARTSRPFSLVMLDLDGFKEYNDKFGHINGDAVLQSFSQVLKASIRKSDLAFRYGGDEFALILPTADAERAKKIMQRARSIWQKAPVTQSSVVGGQVDFSAGIAEYPVNAESADGMVFLADAALYQAKKRGGREDKLVSELSTLSTGILDMATQDQVYALAATVDARDPYTYGHSQRVAEIAKLIGRAIGMAEEDLAKLHAAALLHDIGKVGVPDSILTKLGKPTKDEWRVIKRHSAEGARIVSYVKELASLVPIILHHHEWYDGTGYPDGLKGIDIPAGARITSIADAYDTMVTKRPYRNVVSPKEACKELKRYAGVQFDPALVDVWCKLVAEAEEKK